MGNNLLDALKKAGLTDEKKAKKAENQKKQQQHRDLKSGKSPEQTMAVVEAAQPKQAVVNVEQQVKERLGQVYKGAALSDVSGRKKFYYQTMDQYIDCMMLSDVASALLERGKYAIVANEAMDDYILVRRATALAIEAIDRKRVILLRRQEI